MKSFIINLIMGILIAITMFEFGSTFKSTMLSHICIIAIDIAFILGVVIFNIFYILNKKMTLVHIIFNIVFPLILPFLIVFVFLIIKGMFFEEIKDAIKRK